MELRRGEGEKGQKRGDDDVVWRWLMVVVTMMVLMEGDDDDDEGAGGCRNSHADAQLPFQKGFLQIYLGSRVAVRIVRR
jgi:hypothetical protein